jgi:hypothetical protein
MSEPGIGIAGVSTTGVVGPAGADTGADAGAAGLIGFVSFGFI